VRVRGAWAACEAGAACPVCWPVRKPVAVSLFGAGGGGATSSALAKDKAARLTAHATTAQAACFNIAKFLDMFTSPELSQRSFVFPLFKSNKQAMPRQQRGTRSIVLHRIADPVAE
jgi:hypothetical protein